MPAVLSEQHICESDVPLNWKSVIEKLVEFENVENDLRGESCKSSDKGAASRVGELRQKLVVLHDDLVRDSEQLLEPDSLTDFDERHDQHVFARSVLLLMKINQCVAADQAIDNAGSELLRHYKPDYYESPENENRLHEALLHLEHVDEEWLKNAQEDIERDLVDARRKQALVQAICDEFAIETNSADLDEHVFQFFSSCYHDSGLVAGEVKIIVTGAMIFFCIPYQDSCLMTDRFKEASAEEQQQVSQFLKKVDGFSHGQFAHFPVFGFLQGEKIDASVMRSLVERTGMDAGSIGRELTRLLAIVPLQDIDKYVAHDVWGHGWQASMLKFDGLYEQLARYADPLNLDESARGHRPAGGNGLPYDRITFGDCFHGRGDNLNLNEETFKRFVELEVAERLPVAMTPVVAEIIADVAEFKIFATGELPMDALPSTSSLKHYPAMLDLMVRDVRVYFWQATKVFRLWASKQSRQEVTVGQLVQRGATLDAAQRETQRAVDVWNKLHKVRFARSFLAHEKEGDEPGQSSLQVNVYTRLALNFLGLHREMLHAYERVGKLSPGELPVKGFRDLLLIAVAVFFEEDPPRNLWRMDEYLSLRILPLCERLIDHTRR